MTIYTDINTLRRDGWDLKEDKIPARILDRAASMAFSYINRYLSGFYRVPFSPVPDCIADISDLLTKAYAISLGSKHSMAAHSTCEFKVGLRLLEDIAKGKAEIVGISRLT